MPPIRPSRLRKLLGFAGVSVAALVGSAVLATTASAHAPTFTATADCEGTIHFEADAWAEPGATDADRTHEDMAVKASVDGHAWHDLPGTYAFDAADDFHFEGSYTPATGWASVRIQAFSRSFAEASSDVVTVKAATGCTTPTPSATIAAASCADQGAVATLTNPGDTPVDFDVNGRTVTVPAHGTQDVTVTFPSDTDTTVTVSAPGMTDVVEQVDYHCGSSTTPTTTPTTPTTTPTTPELLTPPPTPPSGGGPVGGPATGEEVTPVPTSDTTLPTQVLGESETAGAPGAAAAPSSDTLPFTGSGTGLALTGIGAVLAGLALAFAARRRTAHR
jgi:hypothetical protein